MKYLMLQFITERQGDPTDKVYPKIQQVLDVKIKDYDDEHGAMGNHYVVRCLMLAFINSGTSPNTITGVQQEATCLVDKREFDNYVQKQKTIIWL